jgi:hypothetical protein
MLALAHRADELAEVICVALDALNILAAISGGSTGSWRST